MNVENQSLVSGIAVIVTSTDGTSIEGWVSERVWTPRQRIVRAITFLGVFWLGALAAIVIPVAHFVLVPGLFIAGPFVAHWISKQESVILGGEALCPQCRAHFPIVQSQSRWPLMDICEHCRTRVTIQRV